MRMPRIAALVTDVMDSLGLQRADIDCDHKTVRVARQLREVAGRQPFLAPPKSDAGKRTVSMPSLIMAT